VRAPNWPGRQHVSRQGGGTSSCRQIARTIIFAASGFEHAHERDEPLEPIDPRRNLSTVDPLVDVTAVEVMGDRRLRLTFAEGTVGDVDLAGPERRGVFEPLRDPAYFARVDVDLEAGTSTWPDGLDTAPSPPQRSSAPPRRRRAQAT